MIKIFGFIIFMLFMGLLLSFFFFLPYEAGQKVLDLLRHGEKGSFSLELTSILSLIGSWRVSQKIWIIIFPYPSGMTLDLVLPFLKSIFLGFTWCQLNVLGKSRSLEVLLMGFVLGILDGGEICLFGKLSLWKTL